MIKIINTLCESHNFNTALFLDAVQEFVDLVHENPTQEVYIGTAKRLLGESLTHDEIMLDIPQCSISDVYISESGEYKVNLNTRIKAAILKLRLGESDIRKMVAKLDEFKKKDPRKTDDFHMGEIARRMGLSEKQVQIILRGYIDGKKNLSEWIEEFQDCLLIEEIPTNTAGSAVGSHDASDGDNRLGKKKIAKRKKKVNDKLE